MVGTSWWNNRRARQAARHLQQSLALLESTAAALDFTQEDRHPTAVLKRAVGEAKLARKTIEELPSLSFTTQSRFFRLFEWLEECMDYAAESIGYEEYAAANVDLCRSRRGIRDAVTLLTTHTGVKAPRALFRRSSRRLSPGQSPMESHGSAHKTDRHPTREQAEPRHPTQVIHLLQTQETPCNPPTRPHLILM